MNLTRQITQPTKPVANGHWFVVTLRLIDGSNCVVVADSPSGAVDLVNRGQGPAETRSRLPVQLVSADEYMNLEDATRHAAKLRR